MTSSDDDSSLKNPVKKDNSQNKDEKKGTDDNGDGCDGLEWGSHICEKKEDDFSDIYMNQKKSVATVSINLNIKEKKVIQTFYNILHPQSNTYN